MKHTKLLITALLSIVTLTAYADASALCAARIGTKGDKNEAFLRWETNDAGDVVITVYGDAGTAFREATGMDRATLLSFTIGDGTLSTTDYFERQYTNNSTVWTLKFIGATPLPAGTVIHFNAQQSVTWKTTEDNNAYAKYNFDYIYGSTCGANPLGPSIFRRRAQQSSRARPWAFRAGQTWRCCGRRPISDRQPW